MLKSVALPYWLVFLVAVGALYGLSFLAPVDVAMTARIAVTDPGKATLDTLGDATKLVATLDTTMLAAAATLIVKGNDWTVAWSRIDGLLALGAIVAGAASYYGQYMAVIETLSIISTGYFNPLATRLQFAMSVQYDALLVGVVFLGLVFARLLEGRLRGAPPPPSAT